jgi:nucleoside-diphosphate-sugar epimerase
LKAEENILIIGSNSFLAKCLIGKLKDTANITGVYHISTHLHEAGVEYINVATLDQLQDVFEVVYLISAYVPEKGNTDYYNLYAVNVELAEKVSKQFPSAHIVLASSVSVYGEPEGIINERTASIKTNPYGLSKLWAEEMIKQHSSYSIHRISSMYGEHMKTSTFLPLICKNAIQHGKITLLGTGERKQNYIHVNDVAESMINAANRKGKGIFLSVYPQSFSNREIAGMIKEQMPGTQIEFQGTDHSPSYVYDAEFSYTSLEWNCKTNMQTGIKQLCEWIKKGS